MTGEYTGVKDDDGYKLCVGDIVRFSFGIPPIVVAAPIEEIDGRYYAMTPDHNPKKCELRRLRQHVGNIYRGKEL